MGRKRMIVGLRREVQRCPAWSSNPFPVWRRIVKDCKPVVYDTWQWVVASEKLAWLLNDCDKDVDNKWMWEIWERIGLKISAF